MALLRLIALLLVVAVGGCLGRADGVREAGGLTSQGGLRGVNCRYVMDSAAVASCLPPGMTLETAQDWDGDIGDAKPVPVRVALAKARAFRGQDGKLYSGVSGREIRFWTPVITGYQRCTEPEREQFAELEAKYTVIGLHPHPRARLIP